MYIKNLCFLLFFYIFYEIIFRDLEMHRSPANASGYGSGVNGTKVPGDNRQRLLSPSNSSSNNNLCNNSNLREASSLSNGLNSNATNANDTSAMQEHFANSAKKVKEKLMLDDMHELLEEPVEEQVRNLFCLKVLLICKANIKQNDEY